MKGPAPIHGLGRLLVLPALIGVLALGGSALHAPTAAAGTVENPYPELIAEWHPCEPGVGVTVIVDRDGHAEGVNSLGDGKIYVRCAVGPQATGVEALQSAGYEIDGVGEYGLGFICRIDGEPTPEEESCERTPGAARFWSYWHGRPGGRWGFSGVGAANPLSASPIDSVEGWSFGGGPRIEPMNGAGPSTFELPPPQASSAAPLALAREWLAPVAAATTSLGSSSTRTKEILEKAIALSRADARAASLVPFLDFVNQRVTSHGQEYAVLQEWANPEGLQYFPYPDDPEFPLFGKAGFYALAVEAVAALGADPSDFAGADPRGELLAMVNPANGRILHKVGPGPYFGTTESADVGELAAVLRALADTGELPEAALKTLELLLEAQDENSGAFAISTATQAKAIAALAAAREDVPDPAAADAALAGAGEYLEARQAEDGGLPAMEGEAPSFDATAAGAVGLALAGRREAAEQAAKWISRYQITAEYAGTADPVTGEPAPAEGLIGAFVEDEATMRDALANGLGSPDSPNGPYSEAQMPTAEALEALVAAGPYGPYFANFDQPSLFFSGRAVGTQSGAQTATLTNHDGRAVSIGGIALSGEDAGDFAVDGSGCAGRTLAPGESCAISASFAPTAVGLREALLEISLGSAGQALVLALGGTGVVPGEEQPGGSGGPSGSRPAVAPRPRPAASATGPARPQAPRLGQHGFALDDRSGRLHYKGRWRRHRGRGAWRGTLSRGLRGASARTRLPAGRPVLALRASPRPALLAVRSRAGRRVFKIASRRRGDPYRQVAAGRRNRPGPVKIEVLKGAIDLDGVTVEP